MRYVLLVLSLVLFAGCQSPQIAGAVASSHTFVLPSSSDVTYDGDTYILLWDKSTGDLVPTAGGAPVAATEWAGADIATAAHAKNTEVYVATIPSLDDTYAYGMTVWSGTNYSNADTLQAGPFLYDPVMNVVYTDTNPIYRNQVTTRNGKNY